MKITGLSLVGLLVVVGILMLLSSQHTIPMMRSGKSAMDDARQLAGKDSSGMRASESVRFSGVMRGQKLVGLQVDSVVMGGPMNQYFGLIQGDVVTRIKELPDLDFIAGNDPDAATAYVLESFQRKQNLEVDRPGVGLIELPRDANKLAATGIPAANPQQPGVANQTVATPPLPATQTPAPPAIQPRKLTVWDQLEQAPPVPADP